MLTRLYRYAHLVVSIRKALLFCKEPLLPFPRSRSASAASPRMIQSPNNSCSPPFHTIERWTTSIPQKKEFLLKKHFLQHSTRSQFKIFKKELHLPSPSAKTGDLFWPDFPQIPLLCWSGRCKPEGLVWITHGFWREI